MSYLVVLFLIIPSFCRIIFITPLLEVYNMNSENSL